MKPNLLDFLATLAVGAAILLLAWLAMLAV